MKSVRKKNKFKIILCGSIAIDRIMNFSGKYRDFLNLGKSDVISFSVFLNHLKNMHGGVGANIAYTLALLGEKPVLVGSVGKDAADYLDKLASFGIDISNVHLSDLPTASFNVITDEENNQIGGFYPGAMFDSKTLTLKKWKRNYALVIIAPHDPKAMRRQIEECFLYKLPYCYDIGQQVINTSPEDLLCGLSKAEILILNEFEISALCQRVGKNPQLLKEMVPLVITTLGSKGVVIEGEGVLRPIKIEAVKPKEVVDPTGAGDAFRGGFFYGYMRGWDLETCGKIGVLAATYAIEKHGTQEHIFTREEFTKRFEDCFGEKLLLI